MSYEEKKKYASQLRVQVIVRGYDNGQEKTKIIPLAEIGMVIGERTWTLEELIKEHSELKALVDAKFVEIDAKLEQHRKALEETIKNLITGGL